MVRPWADVQSGDPVRICFLKIMAWGFRFPSVSVVLRGTYVYIDEDRSGTTKGLNGTV
jgi:hypothetical protein